MDSTLGQHKVRTKGWTECLIDGQKTDRRTENWTPILHPAKASVRILVFKTNLSKDLLYTGVTCLKQPLFQGPLNRNTVQMNLY